MVYDNKQLKAATAELDSLVLDFPDDFRWLAVDAVSGPYVYLQVMLDSFFDKPLVIEGPVERSNCRLSPVKGLVVISCNGGIQITNHSPDANEEPREDKPREDKPVDEPEDKPEDEPEEKPGKDKPANPSLDDLSPEQLRMLLKEILGRL